jgi:hypothetical protein
MSPGRYLIEPHVCDVPGRVFRDSTDLPVGTAWQCGECQAVWIVEIEFPGHPQNGNLWRRVWDGVLPADASGAGS